MLNAISAKAKALVDAAKTAADAAKKAADAAKTAADTAKINADKANSLLADIANDNKLTAQEKQQTKKEWDVIVSEKPKNDASADKYGVSKTSYGNAYNTLSSYITPLLSSLNTTSDITGTDFRAKFKAYYDARTDLLNAISAKAKALVDAAKTAAANAQSRADAAYNKKIELAQLGTTVISGGFIKTSLIKADEIIVSKLSGATGTFKQLQAVGSDGNVKGTLRLDGDRLWYDGDQYQQGVKDGRPLRYYLSDAWVRGKFGARTRTTLLVQGSSGYFYPKGVDKAGVYKSFERGTASDGRTYYKLPCYGLEEDYSGMPVDLIVFNVISSNQHFYELQLAVTQKVNMINCNNNYTNVLIYCNGNYPGLPGGSVHYAWNVLPFLNPQPTANVLGRGLLFGGSNDNDWK